MKNLKIALILLAAVAMFCSCGKDEDAVQDATTVKMTSDVTRLDLRTMEEVVSPLIDLEVTTANEEKITKVTGTVSFYNAEGSADAVSTISFDDFKKDVTYKTQLTFDIAKELMTANGYTKVVVEVIAKAKVEGKGQCTIEFYTSEPEPETTTAEATGDFTWKKTGNASQEGIDEFGMEFGRNFDRMTYVRILKIDENVKLYKLEAADYDIENLEALNEKLTGPREIQEYTEINVTNQNTDYDNVIVSVYNGKTNLIHITHGNVANESAGSVLTVTGTYKRFANPTPAETK